jgi:hypothetical protein
MMSKEDSFRSLLPPPDGLGSEALTSPALLSQRERRENSKTAPPRFFCRFSPLSLWERGVGE